MTGAPVPVDRAQSFGSVAELYERYRSGYPDAVVETVVRHARRPVRSALEVGAGTGKATRVFAAQGISVRALEPDPAMARVLASTTHGLPVQVSISTLEQLRTDDRFDLVYAAASWHWVDPAVRWARAVELLAPGGVLALFGRPCKAADPQVRAAVRAIEQDVLLDGSTGGHPWDLDDVAATPGLVDAVQADLPGTSVITIEQYLGRLSTVSAYVMLAPDVRAAAFDRIRAALPDRLSVEATVRLCVARRA